MQFEYDPERLIDEVRKRPGIWDFDDSNYRTKETRHKLWTEVVQEMLGNAKVTKSELRELELQLQKKWKSIRDCFLKYINNPNRTKRPYIYYKQMQFLLKTESLNVVENEVTADSESDEGPSWKKRKWKPKKKLQLIKDKDVETSEEENDTGNYQEDNLSYSNDEEVTSTPVKVPKTNKSFVEEFAFVDPKNEAEDPDKLFLLSLLPHLKSIPEEVRLNAKMDLMQVLRNANYSALNDRKM